MSRENFEVVKRLIAALNARDIDGCLACCTPTIQVRTPWGTRGGEDEGPEGIRRFWTDVQDASPDFKVYVDGLLAAAENRVLAFVRGTASFLAVPLEVATMNVCSFFDGKIDRIEVFLDRQEALEAVGLRE